LPSSTVAYVAHASPDAPSIPICIGPAAPNALAPEFTPGSVVWPSSLSTFPMPASTGHGTPYWSPTS
jgi:hypothetical protein